MQFTTEIIQGSPEYRVVYPDGTIYATSHCVNVPANLFTVVVDGKWGGVMSEEDALATLNDMCS